MTKARDLSQIPNATLAFRNRIINGAMMIDQRNAGASGALDATSRYTIDRFLTYNGTSATGTIQRSTVAPNGFTNSLLVSVTTSGAATATQETEIIQRIEGFNIADLGWGTANAQPVTLSFWVRSSLTGTFSGGLVNASGTRRSYVFTYTISSANTWEYKTVSVPGVTDGTWATDNFIGLSVILDLGSGSNFVGTAGSWTSGAFFKSSGSVNLVGTNGATFYITGVQLEKGSTATSFDYRPYGTELALCQRYFYLFGPSPVVGASDGRLLVNPILGHNARLALPLVPVEMRTTPTPVFYNTAGTSGGLSEFSSGSTFTVSSTNDMTTNGGGWAQLSSSLTNGVRLRSTYSAEL